MVNVKRMKDSDKTKAKIIQSTVQLLVKKGATSSVSTMDICTAAKLTKPTFYHYFQSKHDLLLTIHKIAVDRDLKPCRAEAARIEDPLARLDYIIRVMTRNICLHRELKTLIHETLTQKDKHFRDIIVEWKSFYLLLHDTIAELRSQERISNRAKASWLSFFVVGMLTWITYWLDYNRKESIDEIAEAAVQFILNGLGFKG